MTMLAIYGLDNYNNFTEMMTDEPEWAGILCSITPLLNTTGGRFGGGFFRFIGQTGCAQKGAFLTLPTDPKTIFFGTSIKADSNTSNTLFLRFKDGTNEHLNLTLIAATNDVQVNILGVNSGNFNMSPNLWHRLEIKLTVDDSAGEITIRLDDTEVFTSTSIDTQRASNAFTNRIDVQVGIGNSYVMNYDDIIVLDDQGSVNNDFLGDLKIETLRPDADGFVNNFTRSAGTTNFENVDEGPGPNDDTDFVESSTVGHQDLYTTDNLSGTPDTVYAVVVRAAARKDDAGSRTIQLLTRTGTTTDVGATQTLLTTYSRFQEIHEIDPDTGVAWTVSGVDGLQIGMENN